MWSPISRNGQRLHPPVRELADRGDPDRAGVSFLSLGGAPARWWRCHPLVLAITFFLMKVSASACSVFAGALVIALGLLVDDAIIAVEMMVVKMEQGWTASRPRPLPTLDRFSDAHRHLITARVHAVAFPSRRPANTPSRSSGGDDCAAGIVDRRVVFTPYLATDARPEKTGGKSAEARCGYLRHAVLSALPRAGDLVSAHR